MHAWWQIPVLWGGKPAFQKGTGDKGKSGKGLGWGQGSSGASLPCSPLSHPIRLGQETEENAWSSPPNGLTHSPDFFPPGLNIATQARGGSPDWRQKVRALPWVLSGILIDGCSSLTFNYEFWLFIWLVNIPKCQSQAWLAADPP